jgi:hypothetical protein
MNLLFKIKNDNGILKTEKNHEHTIDPTPHRFTPD